MIDAPGEVSGRTVEPSARSSVGCWLAPPVWPPLLVNCPFACASSWLLARSGEEGCRLSPATFTTKPGRDTSVVVGVQFVVAQTDVTVIRPKPRIACVPLALLCEMMAMPPRKPIAATGVRIAAPRNASRHPRRRASPLCPTKGRAPPSWWRDVNEAVNHQRRVGADVERRLVDEQDLDAAARGGLDLLVLDNLGPDLDHASGGAGRRPRGGRVDRAGRADRIGAGRGRERENRAEREDGEQQRKRSCPAHYECPKSQKRKVGPAATMKS